MLRSAFKIEINSATDLKTKVLKHNKIRLNNKTLTLYHFSIYAADFGK
jgi:hypothetical protein